VQERAGNKAGSSLDQPEVQADKSLSVSRFLRALSGLQFKCTVAVAAFVIFVCGVVLVLQLHSSARQITSQLIVLGRELSLALSTAALPAVADEDRDRLSDLVRRFVTQDSVSQAAVVGCDGRLITGWSNVNGKVQILAGDKLDPRILELTELAGCTDGPVLQRGRQTIVALAAVTDPSDKRCLAFSYVMLDLARWQGQLHNLQWRTVKASKWLLIVVVPLVFYLVRRLVKPINALSRAAQQVAAGDFSVKIQANRRDELGELATAFNKMTDDLARSHSQLKEMNVQLEQKVQQRTVQLQAANERLRSELAEKEAFGRAVAHDLGAPLRNIMGMVRLITSRYNDQLPEKVRQRLKLIEQAAEQADDLLNELSELSRLRTMREKRRQVDMQQLVEQLFRQFEYSIKSGGIEATIETALPTVEAEPTRIRQLLQNLIDNAVKYIGLSEVKQIRVGHIEHDHFHHFYVRDTGPGIKKDEQERVFFVFHRCKGPTEQRVPGKGVGLTTCKTIVENHGGKIWVDSDPPHGCTVHFTICKHAPAADGLHVEQQPTLQPLVAG